MIIHVCVRLEFPELLARAPCLRISELDRLVSGFAPNTCVLPWKGKECLMRHPHTAPAVAGGHRMVFFCHRHFCLPVGTLYCRSALFFAEIAFLGSRPLFIHFMEIFCASCDSWHQLFSPPYTCMEGSPSSQACCISFARGSPIREGLSSWI